MIESSHVDENIKKDGLVDGMFASGQESKAGITGSPPHTHVYFFSVGNEKGGEKRESRDTKKQSLSGSQPPSRGAAGMSARVFPAASLSS